jgi:hypothetical protein
MAIICISRESHTCFNIIVIDRRGVVFLARTITHSCSFWTRTSYLQDMCAWPPPAGPFCSYPYYSILLFAPYICIYIRILFVVRQAGFQYIIFGPLNKELSFLGPLFILLVRAIDVQTGRPARSGPGPVKPGPF